MSIATIDRRTYNRFLSDMISRYVRQGIPRREAIGHAHWIMDGAFRVDDTSRSDQLDHDEEREGTMR